MFYNNPHSEARKVNLKTLYIQCKQSKPVQELEAESEFSGWETELFYKIYASSKKEPQI